MGSAVVLEPGPTGRFDAVPVSWLAVIEATACLRDNRMTCLRLRDLHRVYRRSGDLRSGHCSLIDLRGCGRETSQYLRRGDEGGVQTNSVKVFIEKQFDKLRKDQFLPGANAPPVLKKRVQALPLLLDVNKVVDAVFKFGHRSRRMSRHFNNRGKIILGHNILGIARITIGLQSRHDHCQSDLCDIALHGCNIMRGHSHQRTSDAAGTVADDGWLNKSISRWRRDSKGPRLH